MAGDMGDELENKAFHFRLDTRDPNEKIARKIIEDAAEQGMGLRELITAALLQYKQEPRRGDSRPEKLIRQQRIATRSMEIAAQTIMEVAEFIRSNPSEMGEVQYEQERQRISGKLQRNMAGLISEASEYDE